MLGLSGGAEDGLKPSWASDGFIIAIWAPAVIGTAGTAGSAPGGGAKAAVVTGAALGAAASGALGGAADAICWAGTAALGLLATGAATEPIRERMSLAACHNDASGSFG